MAKKDVNQSADQTATKAADASKYRYIYARKTVERRVHRRKLATVFLVFVLIAMLLTGMVYAVLAFVDNNDFRITIERGRGVLALSEEASFAKSTTQLTTSGPSEMYDNTFNDLPFGLLRTQDGSITQFSSYYASSFYLTNLGNDIAEYRELIMINNTINRLEECIRVLIIREPLAVDEEGNYVQRSLNEDFSTMHYTCYAKAKEDGSAEQVAYQNARDGGLLKLVTDPNPDAEDKTSPWMCTNFVENSNGDVTSPVYYTLGPKERVRYSLIVWIEGTDPDTIDERVGGQLSIRFGFSTLSLEEQTIS